MERQKGSKKRDRRKENKEWKRGGNAHALEKKKVSTLFQNLDHESLRKNLSLRSKNQKLSGN